jgi:hypothetical protein
MGGHWLKYFSMEEHYLKYSSAGFSNSTPLTPPPPPPPLLLSSPLLRQKSQKAHCERHEHIFRIPIIFNNFK